MSPNLTTGTSNYDQTINDRMHLRIARWESPRWFTYWVERFDAIWSASSRDEQAAAPRGAADAEAEAEQERDQMSEDPVRSALDRLAVLGPRRVAFVSGAGVSVEPPTGCPSGAALTRRVCEAFFPERTFDTLLGYHAAVGWIDTDVCAIQRNRSEDLGRRGRLPRLETVLGVAMQVLDRDGRRVLRILDDVRTAVANGQHAALAAHLRAGGHQVTLNFDDCIEQRLALLGADPAAEDRLDPPARFIPRGPRGSRPGDDLARIEPGFESTTGVPWSRRSRMPPRSWSSDTAAATSSTSTRRSPHCRPARLRARTCTGSTMPRIHAGMSSTLPTQPCRGWYPS